MTDICNFTKKHWRFIANFSRFSYKLGTSLNEIGLMLSQNLILLKVQINVILWKKEDKVSI